MVGANLAVALRIASFAQVRPPEEQSNLHPVEIFVSPRTNEAGASFLPDGVANSHRVSNTRQAIASGRTLFRAICAIRGQILVACRTCPSLRGVARNEAKQSPFYRDFSASKLLQLRAPIQRYNNSFHADFCGFRRRPERFNIFRDSLFNSQRPREGYVCCNPPFL